MIDTAEPASMTARGRDVALLAVFCTVLFFVGLGARDLWNPNEPAYGEAVVEMVERGSWSVPTVNQKVFAEKPILYYWLALSAAKLTGGVSEFSLRLPSALAGIAAVLLLYQLVVAYAGPRWALYAGLCLAAQQGFWWVARSIQMDILLTLCVLATCVPFLLMVDHGASPRLAILLTGVAAGFGFVAKGPLGWLLPALIVGPYLLLTKRSPLRWIRSLVLIVAIAVIVAAPWYLALWASGRQDVLYEVLIRQNFVRYVQAWDHDQPWWYYLRYFWVELAPVSWLVPVAVGLRGRSLAERRLIALSWAWVLVPMLLFSVSESKRAPYLIPIAPAVAILAGTVLVRWRERDLGGARLVAARVVSGIVLALGPTLGTVLLIRGSELVPDQASAVRNLGLAFLVVSALWLAIALFESRHRALLAAGAGGLLFSLYLIMSTLAVPLTNSLKSARGFSVALRTVLEEGSELVSYRLWDWRAEYSFYARQVIPNLQSEAEVLDFWRQSRRPHVLVEEDRLEAARQVLTDSTVVHQSNIGGRRAYILAKTRPSED